MAKWRIVKMKNTQFSYKVQKRVLGFWINTYWQFRTLSECEWFVDVELKEEKIKRYNPRDIVVKTY